MPRFQKRGRGGVRTAFTNRQIGRRIASRYGLRKDMANILRTVADWLDDSGQVVGQPTTTQINDAIRATDAQNRRDIADDIRETERRETARETRRELGDEFATSDRTVPPPIPGRGRDIPPPIPKRGRTTPPPIPGTGPPSSPKITAISTPGYRGRHSPLFHDPDPESDFVEALHPNQFSEQHMVLNSTNVYSYMYDFFNNTLFVTYRAYNKVKKSSQWETAGGDQRPNFQGVTYAYFHVEERQYYRMRGYASKGEYVWDSLRKRGTIEGTQYEYSAVDPQTNKDGSMYVPRKATSKGFRNRSIVIGDKTRTKPKIVRNTLPEQKFSTRRRR